MNSIAQAQNIVQDFAIWEAENPASCLAMISPDTTAFAHLRVSEEHKYIFPEFEGFSGKILLESILSAILPLSLFYTWEKTMSFGGIKPWPSTQAIAKRAGRSIRTIQDNLKALRDLGFLQESYGVFSQKKDKEVIFYDVTYKDFSRLYHFAHEYYEWTRTPLYQLYQPTHAHCRRLKEKHALYEAMDQNSQLYQKISADDQLFQQIMLAEYVYQKVIRFANYQRHLPYINNITIDEISNIGGFIPQKTQSSAETRTCPNKNAPYETRKNSNKIVSISDSNQINSSFVKFCDSINDSFDILDNVNNNNKAPFNNNIAINDNDQNTFNNQLCIATKQLKNNINDKSQENMQIPIQTKTVFSSINYTEDNNLVTPLQLVPHKKENLLGQNAKHAKFNKYKELPLKEENMNTIKDAKSYLFPESLQERNDRINRNKEIKNIMSHLSPEFNDQSERSTLTRVCRIFERSGLEYKNFKDIMYFVRKQVNNVADNQIRVRGTNGKANRVPLWFHLLEEVVEMGLDKAIARDEAARQAREAAEEDYQKRLEQEIKNLSQPHDEPSREPSEVDQALDANNEKQDNILEHYTGNAKQANEQSECSLNESQPIGKKELQCENENYGEKVRKILLQIRKEKGWNIFYFEHKCRQCGGHLHTRTKRGAICCITCDPPSNWDLQMRAELAKILTHRLPNEESGVEQAQVQFDSYPEDDFSVQMTPEPKPSTEEQLPQSPTITEAEVQGQAYELLMKRTEGARSTIENITKDWIVCCSDGCDVCGCHLALVVPGSQGPQYHCIICSPPERWGPRVRTQVKNTLARIPKFSWCYDRIKLQMTIQGYSILFDNRIKDG